MRHPSPTLLPPPPAQWRRKTRKPTAQSSVCLCVVIGLSTGFPESTEEGHLSQAQIHSVNICVAAVDQALAYGSHLPSQTFSSCGKMDGKPVKQVKQVETVTGKGGSLWQRDSSRFGRTGRT